MSRLPDKWRGIIYLDGWRVLFLHIIHKMTTPLKGSVMARLKGRFLQSGTRIHHIVLGVIGAFHTVFRQDWHIYAVFCPSCWVAVLYNRKITYALRIQSEKVYANLMSIVNRIH